MKTKLVGIFLIVVLGWGLLAMLPSGDDYQCTIWGIYYADSAGREIFTDFSQDVMEQKDGSCWIEFSPVNCTVPPGDMNDDYVWLACDDLTATCLYLSGVHECTMGVGGSGQGIGNEAGGVLFFGDTPSTDLVMEVGFSDFLNVSDVGNHSFFIGNGAEETSCFVFGAWVVPPDNPDEVYLVLSAEIEDAQEHTIAAMKKKVIGGLDPATTSVVLIMLIENDVLEAHYAVNDSGALSLGRLESPVPISGYTGNDDGFWPFVGMEVDYEATAESELAGVSSDDDHDSWYECFISVAVAD